MHGFIRAVADQTHPLQTKLSLILTDFEPNRNKQAVPRAEAENILRTAKNSPLKINFDGGEVFGHTGARPIGTIESAFSGNDNGREVILATAIVWNDINPEVDDHIKVAFAEGIGTSWEIYYNTEESTTDENGVEWLSGCVFAGTCIVDTPAYGPNRTRLLAIAEELNKREETTETLLMAQDTQKENTAVAADTLTGEIQNTMDIFSKLYEGLWNMLEEADQLERELATTDITTVAEQFTKAISSIQAKFDALKNKVASAELIEAELTELKDGIAKAEIEKAEAEKLNTRKSALSEIGIELDNRKEFYLSLSDEAFTTFVEDLNSIKGTKVVAEVKKPIIPEPITGSATTTITIQELAAVLRG